MAGCYLPARDISCVPRAPLGQPGIKGGPWRESGINQGEFGLSAHQMG